MRKFIYYNIVLFLLVGLMTGCATKMITYDTLVTGAEGDEPSVTLAWDANSEDNLAGYKLYYDTDDGEPLYEGTGATNGDSPVTIYLEDDSSGSEFLTDPTLPVYEVYGLENNVEYWFGLTAFDTDGLESDYSDIISYTVSADGTITIEKIGNIKFIIEQ